VHALVSFARDDQSSSRGEDSQIQEKILAALAGQKWAPHVTVVVKGGVAELWGVITDDRERQGIIVAVENVPGVLQIHDHLVWVEPMSGIAFGSPEDETRARAAS
jgi:osmotically-inducible protein OsmY